MPTLRVETKTSNSVWRSPDGQREIFEVGLDYNGAMLKAKTYSKDISSVGWSGDVESYEKESRNGSETFVKQPQKEGFQGGGGSTRSGTSPSSQSGYGAGGGKDDQFTMYLSYVKDIVVAMLATKEGFDEGKFGELLAAVSVGGKTLYDDRPGQEPKQEATQLDIVHEVTGNETDEDLLRNIDEVFAGTKEKESPWPKT